MCASFRRRNSGFVEGASRPAEVREDDEAARNGKTTNPASGAATAVSLGSPNLPVMSAHHHETAIGLTILANSHCPHCVQAVDHLTDWAVEEGIRVAGLDLWQHPEAGDWLEAEHSPLLVFEAPTDRVYVGMPTHAEFVRLVRD